MNNVLKEGVDYEFYNNQETSDAIVNLTSGEFNGVSFAFGDVGFEVDEAAEEYMLNYSYSILNHGGFMMLDENDDFKNYIGYVLTNIIEKAVLDSELVVTGKDV